MKVAKRTPVTHWRPNLMMICENGHLDDQDDEEDRDDHNDHDDHDYPDDVFMVKMTNLHPTSLIAPLRN